MQDQTRVKPLHWAGACIIMRFGRHRTAQQSGVQHAYHTVSGPLAAPLRALRLRIASSYEGETQDATTTSLPPVPGADPSASISLHGNWTHLPPACGAHSRTPGGRGGWPRHCAEPRYVAPKPKSKTRSPLLANIFVTAHCLAQSLLPSIYNPRCLGSFAETLRACPSTFLCAIRLLAPHARRLSRYPWNPLYHQPSSLPVPLADRPPSSSIFYRPPTPPATSSLRSTVNCHIVPILRSLTAAVHCYVKTSIRGTGRGYFGV
jgi:hypothetical protein